MGNMEEVKELLEGGADVNEQNDVSSKKNKHEFPTSLTCRGRNICLATICSK